MRFAHPWWLAGSAIGLVAAAALIIGAWLHVRASRRFGDDECVRLLVTGQAASRRALKAILLVLAVAIGFVALAQPQYGRGTRLVPATNLDVVIALDYSKSMHARDVTPSRIERAKAEVARLIRDLPGARVGAIAFAGEPLSFPLTSDGAAIAQFFRQLTPEDMPIGGTAIARALGAGLELFHRDPVSARHRRVVVLVTDGEDLEGDPVAVAETAAKEQVTIHVVQIGGRTPEPIPEIDEHGNVIGWRKDAEGQPLTTALTAEGEEQLGKIARASGGNVVRSKRGNTGISEIAAAMRRMMTEELTDRVETIFADVYAYPLALAFLLLVLETFVPEVSRKKETARKTAAAGAAGIALLVLLTPGCRDSVFTRHSPTVDDALTSLDAGDPSKAASLLEAYLSTGECKGGELGTPDPVRTYSNASLDLGLALFRIAERFGAKFGDTGAVAGGTPQEPNEKRNAEVDCALRVVRVAGEAPGTTPELRGQASYLAGNLEFLRGNYEEAVAAYDATLKIFPALPSDKGDTLGVKAAWNRAIALRLIEEKKKPDSGKPEQPDGGDQGKQDGDSTGDGGQKPESSDAAGPPKNQDQKDDQKKNDQKKDEDQKDKSDQQKPSEQKRDDKGNEPKPEPQQQAPQQKQPSLSQDERMLDELEDAPTVQQEAAKRNAGRVRMRGMVDK